jgi:hypothetical protein
MPELAYKTQNEKRLVAGPKLLLVTVTINVAATMCFKVSIGEFTLHVVH